MKMVCVVKLDLPQ